MPDLILEGGCVLTGDPAVPRASAVAIVGGRIAAVGERAQVARFAGSGAQRIDLAGAAVVPGFDDAHVHVWKMGHLLTGMLDLRPAGSLAELSDALRRRASALAPDDWLVARGYNEARLAEGRGPVREDLDRAIPGRPALLTRTCGHIAVASTAALELAGVVPGTPDPAGGAIDRDAHGRPTGVLRETAMGLVSRHVPEPTMAQLEAMILAGARQLLALGVTAATDAGVTPEQIAAYRALDARGELPIRIHAMALRRPLGDTRTLPLPERHVSTQLKVDAIKLVADGGLSGGTAALSVPYRNKPDRGLLRLDAAEIVELGRDAHLAGLRIGIHAIGDVAIDACLDAFERLRALAPGPRHRIEHFGLASPEQIARAVRLGVTATLQPIFLHELGANFLRYLPESFLGRCYPIRAMLDAGLSIAFSSDAPVVADANPLTGLAAAVLRRDTAGHALAPEQAIRIEEALAAYTLGGAAAAGEEASRGTLSPGKWADLAVLDRNPLETPAEELGRVRVLETYVGGVARRSE